MPPYGWVDIGYAIGRRRVGHWWTASGVWLRAAAPASCCGVHTVGLAVGSKVVERLLLDIRQRGEVPAARLLLTRAAVGIPAPLPVPPAGREKPVSLLMMEHRQGELLEVVGALQLPAPPRAPPAPPAAAARSKCR